MANKFQTQKTTRVGDLAVAGKCPNCRSKVWRILVNGLEVILDPELLSPIDELKFRVANPQKSTYSIHRFGESWFAKYRSQKEIIDKPVGELILASHLHKVLATADLPTYFPPRFTYEIPERPAF